MPACLFLPVIIFIGEGKKIFPKNKFAGVLSRQLHPESLRENLHTFYTLPVICSFRLDESSLRGGIS